MRSLSELAAAFAEKAHSGQVDKAGRPYMEHPAFVAAHVEGEAAKAAAFLHDVLEDTAYTQEDLRDAGFPAPVVEAVVGLTRREGEDYFDFVRRAGSNPIARTVKAADLRHNMDLSRLGTVTERDRERAEKYRRALEILELAGDGAKRTAR